MTSQAAFRSTQLDLLKTALVYGMILTHVLQVVGTGERQPATFFAALLGNLTSFSGFLLALGIGLGLGAARPRQKTTRERLVDAGKLLGAYTVSALGYLLLVRDPELAGASLADLLSLRTLVGHSEFLASFLMLYLLITAGRERFIAVAARPVLLVAAACCSALATCLIVPVALPIVPTLLADATGRSFPLLPYLPWFLVGVAIGLRGGELPGWTWVPAIVMFAAFIKSRYSYGFYGDRFPPGVFWVAGAALPLLAAYKLAGVISRNLSIPRLVLLPGQRILSLVVISNLVLFGAQSLVGKPVTRLSVAAALAVVLIQAISIGLLAWERLVLPVRLVRAPSSAPAAG